MRKLLLFTALVVLTARAFCRGKEINFECGEIGAGKAETHTQVYPVNNKFAVQVIVTVSAKNIGTEKSPSCKVSWQVAIRNADHQLLQILRHSEQPEETIFASDPPKLSEDGTKLLVDFIAAEGDYTGHRPAVYDFITKQGLVRSIDGRVTQLLPDCDYFTMVDGVTNDGDIIIHVPKSMYVDKGCPDQGRWLLNMKTNRITRLKRKNAISKKSAH